MKKYFIFFMAFGLFLGMFTGCSSSGKETATKSSNNQENSNENSSDIDWPQEPIHLVVAFGAGGVTDTEARTLQPYLQEALDTSVVVENKPGAGTQVGTNYVANQKPDGNTVLVSNQVDFSKTIAEGAKYADEMIPIAAELTEPRLLFVKQDSSLDNLKDFVEKAETNPGSLTIGHVQGAVQGLFAEWLIDELNLDVRTVGFDSGGETSQALNGGHIDAMIGEDYGRYNLRDELKALAIAAPKPSERWPEAETFAKQLEPFNVEMPSENFLARTQLYFVRKEFKQKHPERYKKLQNAFIGLPDNPDYMKKIENLKMEDLMNWRTGEEYTEQLKEDLKTVEGLVKNN